MQRLIKRRIGESSAAVLHLSGFHAGGAALVIMSPLPRMDPSPKKLKSQEPYKIETKFHL